MFGIILFKCIDPISETLDHLKYSKFNHIGIYFYHNNIKRIFIFLSFINSISYAIPYFMDYSEFKKLKYIHTYYFYKLQYDKNDKNKINNLFYFTCISEINNIDKEINFEKIITYYCNSSNEFKIINRIINNITFSKYNNNNHIHSLLYISRKHICKNNFYDIDNYKNQYSKFIDTFIMIKNNPEVYECIKLLNKLLISLSSENEKLLNISPYIDNYNEICRKYNLKDIIDIDYHSISNIIHISDDSHYFDVKKYNNNELKHILQYLVSYYNENNIKEEKIKILINEITSYLSI